MDSFWEELQGLYICNNCKYYTENAKDECPKCGSKMVGIQLELKNKN